jgi:hypothetical protein
MTLTMLKGFTNLYTLSENFMFRNEQYFPESIRHFENEKSCTLRLPEKSEKLNSSVGCLLCETPFIAIN